ncbi:hypothetical protein OAF34_01770 [Pirellulaceae bacterium]|nr:hypothetical protein [Pirellulaceae bacterium]
MANDLFTHHGTGPALPLDSGCHWIRVATGFGLPLETGVTSPTSSLRQGGNPFTFHGNW